VFIIIFKRSASLKLWVLPCAVYTNCMRKCLHFWNLNIMNLQGLELLTVHQHNCMPYKYLPIKNKRRYYSGTWYLTVLVGPLPGINTEKALKWMSSTLLRPVLYNLRLDSVYHCSSNFFLLIFHVWQTRSGILESSLILCVSSAVSPSRFHAVCAGDALEAVGSCFQIKVTQIVLQCSLVFELSQ